MAKTASKKTTAKKTVARKRDSVSAAKKKEVLEEALNEGHLTEALDRTNLLADLTQKYLMEHPVFKRDEVLMNMAMGVGIVLEQIYKRIRDTDLKNDR